MATLIERLHSCADFHESGADDIGPDILREAANEIERLRTVLQNTHARINGQRHDIKAALDVLNDVADVCWNAQSETTP